MHLAHMLSFENSKTKHFTKGRRVVQHNNHPESCSHTKRTKRKECHNKISKEVGFSVFTHKKKVKL